MVSGISAGEDDPNDREERAHRTFLITPGPPQGMSYAKDIATRYGISYEKLADSIKKRQAIAGGPDMDSANIV